MAEQGQSAINRAGTEPESLWIQQIAGGDRDAFEKLYKAYAARLFRYLFSVVGDANAAEELANDVMVAAWKGAASFKGQSKPSTWLFGIAHHKALNELRRRQPQMVEIEQASDVAASGEGPDTAVRRESLEQSVRSALRALSAEHREVVELTFY
jgi:RNA polymerase sigma-70 factor (ECF subfamily)